METLQSLVNLVPMAGLAWMFWIAFRDGSKRDQVDVYFQKTRYQTGKKFCNFFGVVSKDF